MSSPRRTSKTVIEVVQMIRGAGRRGTPPRSDRARDASGPRPRWCPARSRFEIGWTGLLAAQLGNILRETQSGEAGSDPRAERSLGGALVPHRVAEDLPDLLFRAAAMAACAALELGLYV